jgi:hypothetical protein
MSEKGKLEEVYNTAKKEEESRAARKENQGLEK